MQIQYRYQNKHACEQVICAFIFPVNVYYSSHLKVFNDKGTTKLNQSAFHSWVAKNTKDIKFTRGINNLVVTLVNLIFCTYMYMYCSAHVCQTWHSWCSTLFVNAFKWGQRSMRSAGLRIKLQTLHCTPLAPPGMILALNHAWRSQRSEHKQYTVERRLQWPFTMSVSNRSFCLQN